MNAEPLQLNPTETQIIAKAANPGTTRRRILYSIFVPLIFCALLLVIFWREAQPRVVLWLFIGYIVINMFEKIGYGFAVLSYKSVIRKLLSRINEIGVQQ